MSYSDVRSKYTLYDLPKCRIFIRLKHQISLVKIEINNQYSLLSFMRDLNLKQGQSQRWWTMPPKKKLKIELDLKKPQLKSFYAVIEKTKRNRLNMEQKVVKKKKGTKEDIFKKGGSEFGRG